MPQYFTNLSLPPSMYEGPLGAIVPAYADLPPPPPPPMLFFGNSRATRTNPPACNFVLSLI